MLDWFQRLMPQQPLFFALFERQAATVGRGAEALRKMLDGGPAIAQHCHRVMQLESEADAITREVLIAVRSTFITPFDRGDIKDRSPRSTMRSTRCRRRPNPSCSSR
jgi:uncharacterized protein Yka (UPF0111/DUF47 family)